jgi:HK97 family phage prohead protease
MKAARPGGSFNQEQRSMRFIMSAEVQDRDGDIVMVNGIDTEQFEKNAVALWGHNHSAVTGAWVDLVKVSGRPKRMEGTHQWAEEGTSPEVDKTFSLARQGFLKACSIGFMVNWKDAEGLFDDDDNFSGIKFNTSGLLECSLCAIPANQAALAKMASSDEGRRLATELMQDTLDNWPKSAAGIFMSHADYAAHLKSLEGEKTVVTVKAVETDETLFTRIGKFFGLKPVEKEAEPTEYAVEETPAPETSRILTDEEKNAAQAQAEAVIKRAESTLAQGA